MHPPSLPWEIVHEGNSRSPKKSIQHSCYVLRLALSCSPPASKTIFLSSNPTRCVTTFTLRFKTALFNLAAKPLYICASSRTNVMAPHLVNPPVVAVRQSRVRGGSGYKPQLSTNFQPPHPMRANATKEISEIFSDFNLGYRSHTNRLLLCICTVFLNRWFTLENPGCSFPFHWHLPNILHPAWGPTAYGWLVQTGIGMNVSLICPTPGSPAGLTSKADKLKQHSIKQPPTGVSAGIPIDAKLPCLPGPLQLWIRSSKPLTISRPLQDRQEAKGTGALTG
ncbi:hypothetical protein CEXT_104981 [Caerostris extrusa]|uniref:Uncharacterized protein n=1 Tax=Caerostris extrusa TaxID=172846 RepID=A0AAV4TEB6_CAEEX|nr:hypothetical protein CEXT_104981 [Caerostris extrusa]